MENIITQEIVEQMMDENLSMKEHFVIPEGVTAIGDGAFFRCENLKSINIPEGVTKIGNDAFCYCLNLESITIPHSVAEIGNWAFDGCYNLKEIIVPEHLFQKVSNIYRNKIIVTRQGVIRPVRQRVHKGSEYFFLSSDPTGVCIRVEKAYDFRHSTDDTRFNKGNYFATYQAAEKVKLEIAAMLHKQ